MFTPGVSVHQLDEFEKDGEKIILAILTSKTSLQYVVFNSSGLNEGTQMTALLAIQDTLEKAREEFERLKIFPISLWR